MTKTTPHNDPAFDSEIGLTKREYLAALAMQGMLAGLYAIETATAGFSGVSKDSVGYADALIAELEKNK